MNKNVKQDWYTPIPDSDVRMVRGYNDVLSKVYEICSDHIQHFKTDEAKQKAIEITWKIYHHAVRVLSELEEFKTIEMDRLPQKKEL